MKILEKSVCREGYSRGYSSGNDWPGERLIKSKNGTVFFFSFEYPSRNPSKKRGRERERIRLVG